MRRVALTFSLGLLVIAGLAVVPAAALDVAFTESETEQPAVEQQPIEPEPTMATWEMVVVAGADGWVTPNEPLAMRVNLRSDLLLVGRIDVSIGGVTSSQAIEIPAGGVKDYFIQGGTPGQRRQVRVQLIEDNGGTEAVLDDVSITLRIPANEVVVAAIGADLYESAIRSATPKPMEQDVQLVRMTAADLANLNSAISYLVLPAGPMAELAAEDVELVRRWVTNGGRLIGAAANVSRVSDPASGVAFTGVDAVGIAVGSGEVTAVNNFDSVDVDGWSELLRSVPQPGIVRVNEDGQNSSLVGSALSGRSASVPALPWLLLGILLFVVLVGPVNFIVLRGFGKPEWAWITVPLLSAVFVAGFWMVGRSQLKPFTVTHTSVVVEAGARAEGRTAFVLQVESGGEHDLRMEPGWNSEGQNFPGADSGVTRTDEAGRAVIGYELDDLGVGTAQGAWGAETGSDIGFTIEATETGFKVLVDNRTDLVFDRWGVVVDGFGWLGSAELQAGAEGTVDARVTNRRNSRYSPVIMEAVERRGLVNENFYVNEYQQVFPMTVIAEQMAPNLVENGIHFFGFTDDTSYDVDVDGSSTSSNGTTLLIVEVPDDGTFVAARTTARPRLLGVDGASSVEQYYEEIYAYGADAIFFHYQVPTNVSGGTINPGFTALSSSTVYDWVAGDYVEFEWGDTLDFSRVASPTGEVVVRAGRADDDRFFDESLTLSRFSLTWG